MMDWLVQVRPTSANLPNSLICPVYFFLLPIATGSGVCCFLECFLIVRRVPSFSLDMGREGGDEDSGDAAPKLKANVHYAKSRNGVLSIIEMVCDLEVPCPFGIATCVGCRNRRSHFSPSEIINRKRV